MIPRIYLVLLALTATLINGSPLQLQQRAKAHYTTISHSTIVTSTRTSTIPETATTTTDSLPPSTVVTTATATESLTVTPTSQTSTTDNPVPSRPRIMSNPFPTPPIGFLAPTNDPITVTERIESQATVTKTATAVIMADMSTVTETIEKHATVTKMATAVIMATADMTTATVTIIKSQLTACPPGYHDIFNEGGMACVKNVA
ncbi:MAG: hypothetical protein Q9172_002199 [Xanthocarpia lactea]